MQLARSHTCISLTISQADMYCTCAMPDQQLLIQLMQAVSGSQPVHLSMASVLVPSDHLWTAIRNSCKYLLSKLAFDGKVYHPHLGLPGESSYPDSMT